MTTLYFFSLHSELGILLGSLTGVESVDTKNFIEADDPKTHSVPIV